MPDSSAGRSLQAACPSEFAPSLGWLIHPASRALFLENYWEKQTLVVNRHQPDYFSPLLSLDDVDRVITTLGRGYPEITLKNANREVTADDYTVDGDALDVARVYQLFSEGATITLAYLDTVVPALTLFCRQLESEFSFPLQTNVYLTPAGAQGAKPHYDTHDVFVLQIAGSKKWTIYGTPLELPLAGQDFDPAIHERGAAKLEFELRAGDAAYIPRGVMHDARSGENVSLHVTAGILRYTWTDLLLELVAELSLRDVAFRQALPPGFARPEFDRAPARATLRSLLQRISTQGNFDAALERFVDEFISACPPVLRGQMAQLTRLDGLTIDSIVGARPGVISRQTVPRASGDGVSVECYGRAVTFPYQASGAVRFALSHPRFVVRELPADLDDAGKLALIRRLIREGLVMIL